VLYYIITYLFTTFILNGQGHFHETVPAMYSYSNQLPVNAGLLSDAQCTNIFPLTFVFTCIISWYVINWLCYFPCFTCTVKCLYPESHIL